MARPRGIPPDLLPPAEGEQAAGEEASSLGDALEGWVYRPGARGPRTTLKPDMIPVIAESLARHGVKRIAAAKAQTTEDCLGAWLRRGVEAVRLRKRSIYTELLVACEEAWAHRYGRLIELGERTVTDRHTNPRFITWLMSVTSPRDFTVPKEPRGPVGGNLGPAFEMVTPEQAARSLEEKLERFLTAEKLVAAERAAAAAAPEGGAESA